MVKKKEIKIAGLPGPWKAYYSEKRQRIFYFNVITKATTWDLSAVKHVSESDLTVKLAETEQHDLLNCSKRKAMHRKRNAGSQKVEEVNQKLDKCGLLNSFCIPSRSEPNDESMEIDEIALEGLNSDEEPMECDFVVGEVQAFRREHFLHPDLISKDLQLAGTPTQYVEASETNKKFGALFIVFDTSCLLHDIKLLDLCIQRLQHALIPYTVLRELEGLMKASIERLRRKAVRINGYLLETSKSGCNYLHIENTFEALNGMEEFGCRNNDDIILKCAFAATKRCWLLPDENEAVNVVFATNDKNLAVKAAAHKIITVDRKELLRLLTNNGRESRREQFSGGLEREISPSAFSFAVAIKSVSPAEECIMKHISSTSEKPQRHTATAFKPIKNKKMSGGTSKSMKKKKLYKFDGHLLDDFLDKFGSLVKRIIQCRRERKSIEDAGKLCKVIDSVIANEASSLSVLIDMVSTLYDFYANRNVFVEATYFDKKQLMEEYDETANETVEKLRSFQNQLLSR